VRQRHRAQHLWVNVQRVLFTLVHHIILLSFIIPNKETLFPMKNWKEVTTRHKCLVKFTSRKGQNFQKIVH